VARAGGQSGTARAYTSACIASSTAVADAASTVSHGRADRVVVAAGYLVEPDQFAIFDAGRALAVDGQVRPFSVGRKGMLLGDGVAAVVVESATAARRRGVPARGPAAGAAGAGAGSRGGRGGGAGPPSARRGGRAGASPAPSGRHSPGRASGPTRSGTSTRTAPAGPAATPPRRWRCAARSAPPP